MAAADYWGVASSVLLSLGGGAAIVLAFSGWLGKVWASRLAEADRLKHNIELEAIKSKYAAELERLRTELQESTRRFQAAVDRTLHVHRLHFETEFAATKDIWRRLAKVRAKMGNVRPVARLVQEGETEEQWLDRTYPPFIEAKNELIAAVDEQSPFLTQELFAKVEEIIAVLNREYVDVATAKTQDAEWRARGQQNFLAIVALVNDASQIIRNRLAQLVVE